MKNIQSLHQDKKLERLKISVIGTGYVGLVSGACFAELGHEVICVDKDRSKIEGLTKGVMPIYEPGLDQLVVRNVADGRLTFSTDLGESVQGRDAVFIAVGTPSSAAGHADLSWVEAACAEIGANLDRFTVVITKSTVPVGTNRRLQAILDASVPHQVVAAIASNPEFLREGAAIDDFLRPDRIVVGATSDAATAVLRKIYAPITDSGHLLVVTDLETAELIKYAANAFLAIKLSYINEIADLCEVVGADVDRVASGIGLDRRIGEAFLKTGPGWGGSCFPKDTRALRSTAADHGVPLRLVQAAIDVNAHRKGSIVAKIAAACGGEVKGKTLGVLGLTFKGQTDDLRESPSLNVIRVLLSKGATIRAYDPSMPLDAERYAAGLRICNSAQSAAQDADALIVLTDWVDFLRCDLAVLAAAMADPVLLDLRNMFDEAGAIASGFRSYERLGRAAARTGAVKQTVSPVRRRSAAASERDQLVVSP